MIAGCCYKEGQVKNEADIKETNHKTLPNNTANKGKARGSKKDNKDYAHVLMYHEHVPIIK